MTTTTLYPSVHSLAYPKMSNNFPVSNQFGFRLPPKLAKEFRASLRDSDGDERPYSPILVDLVRGYLSGTLSNKDQAELEAAPLLDVHIACGPPDEARDEASLFLISQATADELSMKGGDVWARTRGESMEGAGILDEFLVLLEPLKTGRRPTKDKIALIRLTDENGNVSGTLKRWEGEGAAFPRVVNGEGKPFEYPTGTVSAEPVAIAKGVIGALP